MLAALKSSLRHRSAKNEACRDRIFFQLPHPSAP
jgi:hypothetical protein